MVTLLQLCIFVFNKNSENALSQQFSGIHHNMYDNQWISLTFSFFVKLYDLDKEFPKVNQDTFTLYSANLSLLYFLTEPCGTCATTDLFQLSLIRSKFIHIVTNDRDFMFQRMSSIQPGKCIHNLFIHLSVGWTCIS